jgi:hypothetical protein
MVDIVETDQSRMEVLDGGPLRLRLLLRGLLLLGLLLTDPS